MYFDYAVGVRQVTNALKILASLTALTIQLDALQPSVTAEACFNCVADALPHLKSLEQLGLCVMPGVVMPWQRRAFPDALATMSKLRSLSLGMAGDVTPIIDLVPICPSCSQLTKLLLKTQNLKSGDAWMRLRNALVHMPELLELHAISSPPYASKSQHAKVQNLSTQQISSALGQLTCLVLDMEWTHESSENISGFLSALSEPSKLKILEICFNDCVDNTAANQQLMMVLPCAVALEQLHLKQAQITGDGMQMMALCCANITQLTRLHLHEAFAEGACDNLTELFTQFAHLNNLQQFALLADGQEDSHHKIPVAAATALGEAFKCMTNLHTVSIRGWQFPRGSVEALAPSFPCCVRLEKLRMSHCFLSSGELVPLVPALMATTTLRKLDMSHNSINDAGVTRLTGMIHGSLFSACDP